MAYGKMRTDVMTRRGNVSSRHAARYEGRERCKESARHQRRIEDRVVVRQQMEGN